MGIEQEFNHFARDSREFQGKVLAHLDNLHQYIAAVNNNNKELAKKVETHMLSSREHGNDAAAKTTKNFVQWTTIVISVVALGMAYLRK